MFREFEIHVRILLDCIFFFFLHKRYSRNLILPEDVRCCIVTEERGVKHTQRKDGHIKNREKGKRTEV